MLLKTYSSCKKQINIDLQVFLVTFFNHLALNIFSTLFQCWSNNCHYFNHISTLKIGHVPAGFQPFSIKRCINVVSTLKQQLTLFQPYFNVEGRSCAGWENVTGLQPVFIYFFALF